MDREDIIKLAREAGLDPDLWNYTDAFERFAALVAAHEREACAKVCEALKPFGPEMALQKATVEDCAAAIRARGNT